MKYVILVGDGLGDYPIPELGGLTPLAAARTPHLDRLARRGLLGRVRTIPPGLAPGSDVANLALMGYDPSLHRTGRAVFEAASLKISLGPDEVAFRCNLVTLKNNENGRPVMADYSSGHLTTEQAQPLVESLKEELGSVRFTFHLGNSYRHILVWSGGRSDFRLTPPHDLSGQLVTPQLDRLRAESPDLYYLTLASWSVLRDHPAAAGLKSPPTSIWLWGQGRPPRLATFPERFGLNGVVISAVDLIKGLGIFVGLEPINVLGATGWLDTNYEGKVAAGLEALSRLDFLYLHIEAPDEAGHTGILAYKLQAIEDFDARVVGPLLEGLERLGPFRLLVACDHNTPLSVMTHTAEPVPVLLFDSRFDLGHSPAFCEAEAAKGPDLDPASSLIEHLLERA